MQVITIHSFAQTQINYTPGISGFTYTNEKVFAADVNADTHQDIITYKSGSGGVSALLHNGNNNVNTMQFNNTYSITLSPDILIDVQCIDAQDTKADLISYAPGNTYIDFYYYQSNGNSFSPAVALTSNLLNGAYQYGTFDINNDGEFEIYALDKLNGKLFYGIIDLNSALVNFSSVNSLPSITSGSIVHIFSGHFQSATLNDLCYVSENTGANNQSAFTVQVLKNIGGTSLSVDFSSSYNGSSNQLFYAGRFTTDNFSDIAVYPADGNIYVLPNTAGTAFGSLSSWQPNLTQPPAAYFLLDGGNYSTSNAYDDVLLLETDANAVPANQGNSYIEVNSGNNSTFNLSQIGVAPCNANPMAIGSGDYHIVQADFDQAGPADIVLFNPSEGICKVGIVLENIATTYVHGYCWPQSAAQGDQIKFYISGTASSGTLDIYRYESRDNTTIPTLVMSTALPNGINVQTTNSNIVKNGCGWVSSYTLTIPGNANWPPGFYAAKVTNNYCNVASINFIVKNDGTLSSKKLLLLVNTNTWGAYNTFSDGQQAGSKYGNNYNSSIYQEYSFMRPESNNNIESNYNTDGVRAELWIYTWLKDNGYDPDLITDLDLHLNTNNFIGNYDYLVMGTHPEYWTANMYDNVKAFQQNAGSGNGGNLICLGGNAVFEVVDIDLSVSTNPRLIAYPNAPAGANAANATAQSNTQYPLPGMQQVGGQANPSPLLIANNYYFDRFDYFLESYNFNSPGLSPINRRSIDLIGTHYQNLAAYDAGGLNTNASYTQSPFINSPLFNGIGNAIWGDNGYSHHYGVVNGSGKAAGWECDRYTPADPPSGLSPLTPLSPATTASVYDNDIQILAYSTPNGYSVPSFNAGINLYFPNGMNNSEIIYVPPQCASPKRGFVFTAGSICFGGSLVWNYDIQNNVYNNDLSRLLKNVLDQTHFNLKLEATNLDCQGGGGSIQAIGSSCTTMTYQLMPGNVTNNTGFFTNATAGVYTITATDANANTVSKTIELIDPGTGNFCCSASAEAIVTTPGVILQISPTASNLLSLYSNGTNTISNKTFYFDGVFDVDADITFKNCILWFTQTGTIQLDASHDLKLQHNTLLQAACDYWEGIKANNAANKVAMDNSTIKNAKIGIAATSNAILEIWNSHFEDNYQAGISLQNSTSPYGGVINNNTFTCQANMPATTFYQPRVGISLQDVAQLNIGNINSTASGNHFEGLKTGILSSNSFFNVNYSLIGIYNNTFTNIKNNDLTGNYISSQKINQCYNSGNGAAIYANRPTIAPTSIKALDIRNTNAANVSLKFDDCDKGIVTSSITLTAKNLYMEDCLMGIMNKATDVKNYDVQDNILDKTFIGMQFIGNNANSIAKNNTISTKSGTGGVQTDFNLYRWPIGIDLRHANNATTNEFIVESNNITIKTYAGIGISLTNSGEECHLFKNTINLTSTLTGVLSLSGATLLNGIYTNNTFKSKMEGNHINGNANLLVPAREDIAGILLNKSTYNELQCNHINNTRFGVMAYSDCFTNPDAIKGNDLFNHVLGWVFRKIGNESTFGDVGDQNDDNNNLFLGNGYVYKVFKFCENPLNDKIFTDPGTLDLNESSSVDINNQALNTCPYLVGPNIGNVTTYTCPPVLNIIPASTTTAFNLSDAILIATHTKNYTSFPELSYWMDMRKLYKQLETDTTFRNSNDTLLNFYDSLQNETVNNIESTENRLIELLASMESMNYELYLQRLEEARETNSNIVSETVQEDNEHDINDIYLKILSDGLDSLTNEDSTRIEELANQCPYIGGTAVYKARALYAMYSPASMFDDIKICNAVGVYKTSNSNMETGKGLFDDENEFLKNLNPQFEKKILHENDLLIYPNPANTQINIRYNSKQDTKLQIVNMLGNIEMEISLAKGNQQVAVQTSFLRTGVYTYRQIQNGAIIKTGKLIITN